MKLEKSEAYIKYCLSLKAYKLTIQEALYLFQYYNPEKKTFPQNEQDINTHFHQLSLLYHPDRNLDNKKQYTCVFQCINAARTLLLEAKNHSENAKYSHRFASGCNSNFNPTWSHTVSTMLTSVAKQGINELTQSCPDVFNKTFLSQQQLVIPVSALVMAGLVQLIKYKKYYYLTKIISVIHEIYNSISVQDGLRTPINITETDSDFASFIGGTDVSCFSIGHMVRSSLMLINNDKMLCSEISIPFNFNKRSLIQDAHSDLARLRKLSKQQQNINKTKFNKRILTQLHNNFKQRAIDPKSGKFKTKRDQLKSDLFEQALAEQSVSSIDVEAIVNVHTGRYTFGLFRFGPPTSKEEYDDLLYQYQSSNLGKLTYC